MSFEIEVKTLPAQRVLLTRVEADAEEFGFAIENALSDVWAHLDQAGSEPAGPPFSIYRSIDVDTPMPPPDPWQAEAGFPIDGDPRLAAGFRIADLPEGPAACLLHEGDYSGLGNAFRILQAWLEMQGREPSDHPRIHYLTDPAAVLEAEDWRTEIAWPLKG